MRHIKLSRRQMKYSALGRRLKSEKLDQKSWLREFLRGKIVLST